MTTKAPAESSPYPPALRRLARPVKTGWRKLACAATERLISTSGAYDILVLFGMRRSGNHLAINWILGQVDGSAVFYNNIRQDAHPFDVGMREYRLRRPNHRPKIILSYEDLTPDDIRTGPLPDFLSERAKRHAARVQSAVILRDPYNLFASRLKKWPERFASDADIAHQQALYANHAQYAENPKPVFGDGPVIPILYNHLVTKPDYRQGLSERLGIRSGDVGLDEVPVYGHGSSFDGYQTESTSVRAGVFDRWKGSAGDPIFQKVLGDARLKEWAETLFDMGSPSA